MKSVCLALCLEISEWIYPVTVARRWWTEALGGLAGRHLHISNWGLSGMAGIQVYRGVEDIDE